MTGALLLQALTNLAVAAPGAGLPANWELRRVRGVDPPSFRVTLEHTLEVAVSNAAGFAAYRLAEPLRPEQQTRGVLSWRWRTATPLPGAALRARATDDSPVRVYVVFADRRMIFYTWGNGEPRDEWFPSWTGGKRLVVVLRGATDADGGWLEERRDPFEDYRRMFARTPPEIVAVGVGADTEQLADSTQAEVGDLRWRAAERPSR